jgi:hypothetical protein
VVVVETLVVVVPPTGTVLVGVPLSEPALVERNTNAAISTTGTVMMTRVAALLTVRWYETSSAQAGIARLCQELPRRLHAEEEVSALDGGTGLH